MPRPDTWPGAHGAGAGPLALAHGVLHAPERHGKDVGDEEEKNPAEGVFQVKFNGGEDVAALGKNVAAGVHREDGSGDPKEETLKGAAPKRQPHAGIDAPGGGPHDEAGKKQPARHDRGRQDVDRGHDRHSPRPPLN